MRASTLTAMRSRNRGGVTDDTTDRSRSLTGRDVTPRRVGKVHAVPLDRTTKRAHVAGRSAVTRLRRNLAQRVADLMQRDPERLASAVELGLIRREWLEDGEGPVTKATPVGVIERALERSVEQRPSALAALGLSAIQILSSGADDQTDGLPARTAVVFTDLEGFTTWTESHGDEPASALLVAHHRAVGPVVRSRGGRVVKRLGDGLLLTFPSPEAAVLAGLELLDCAPAGLRLRAGIHEGEVVVTRDDVIGHVVNVAARVTESAKGGEVLVTEEVRDATRSLAGVSFGRLRRKAYKGLAEAVRVYPVRSVP
jgi:adenylate cyclase